MYPRNTRRTYGYRYPVTTTFPAGRRPYSSSTSRSMGAARASKNATKLDYFNCTVTGNASFLKTANQNYSDVIAFHPYLGGVDQTTGIIRDSDNANIYGGVVNDRNFRLRCASWDEYRLVSMKIKLSISPPSDMTGTWTLCSITDRQANRDELEMDEAVMTDVGSDTPSFREVCESPGSIKTIINTNRINNIVRTVYARDMTEKISYEDATVGYNTIDGQSPLRTLTMMDWTPFSPATYFCIKFSTTDSQNKTFTFAYTVEYNVIFRNPKSDLQTFIIKEDPNYTNPEESSGNMSDPNRRLTPGTTIIKSTDPYIPDMTLKNGQETNVSWYNRLKARFALKNATRYRTEEATKTSTSTLESLLSAAEEEEKKQEETKPMDIEDDPGTA